MFALLKKQTENIRPTGSFENGPAKVLPGFIDGDREFFRIDATVGLRYWPLFASGQIATAERYRVNLSGGGIRFTLAETLHVSDRVWLEIILPDAQASIITCIGRVVRRFRGKTGEIEAAFEFVKLATRDQDRIVSFCLGEERKRLREKVRVSC